MVSKTHQIKVSASDRVRRAVVTGKFAAVGATVGSIFGQKGASVGGAVGATVGYKLSHKEL